MRLFIKNHTKKRALCSLLFILFYRGVSLYLHAILVSLSIAFCVLLRGEYLVSYKNCFCINHDVFLFFFILNHIFRLGEPAVIKNAALFLKYSDDAWVYLAHFLKQWHHDFFHLWVRRTSSIARTEIKDMSPFVQVCCYCNICFYRCW